LFDYLFSCTEVSLFCCFLFSFSSDFFNDFAQRLAGREVSVCWFSAAQRSKTRLQSGKARFAAG